MQFVKAMGHGRSESDFTGEGALKMLEQEHLPFWISEPEPCIMFFSNVGCSLGERCRFKHSGINPSAGNANFGGKSLQCYKYYTDDGCGDISCPYAHGPDELRGPTLCKKVPDDMAPRPVCSFAEGIGPQTSFGASIRMTRSFCSPRSSTEGMNAWLMGRVSGARISLIDHESDPSMLKVMLEGTVEQVELATNLVRDHVAGAGPAFAPPPAFALPPNSHARHK